MRRHSVLMDIQMPVMNGLDATRAIRKLPDHALTQIIAISASTSEDQINECLAAGCNYHLPKPFEPNQLWEILHTALADGVFELESEEG